MQDKSIKNSLCFTQAGAQFICQLRASPSLLLLLLLLSRFSRVRLCATPFRRQPTRLPRPWDSPGKNTGVGCHFLLQWVKVKSESEVAQSCLTLCYPMDFSLPGSSIHGISQARVLEWGAIAFSSPSLQNRKRRKKRRNRSEKVGVRHQRSLLLRALGQGTGSRELEMSIH